MSRGASLFLAGLCGAAVAGAMVAFRPGPVPLAQGAAVRTDVLNGQQAGEDVSRLAPQAPAAETVDLVPQAMPDEPAAIARGFFARPAPSDADLAARPPFAGTDNVPIGQCAASWPKAARDELSLGSATPQRRMKDEIYARLNLRQVLETADCSCAGKVAPFEPVAPILAEVIRRDRGLTGTLFNAHAAERRRLQRAVQRLCGGSF